MQYYNSHCYTDGIQPYGQVDKEKRSVDKQEHNLRREFA